MSQTDNSCNIQNTRWGYKQLSKNKIYSFVVQLLES